MRRHKVILEVEVYVEDDENPEDRSKVVVECLEDYIGSGSSGDPYIACARVVSVDKEPLPPSEDELKKELFCGHGRSRMDPEDCVECNRNAKYVIEGIHKRDVM